MDTLVESIKLFIKIIAEALIMVGFAFITAKIIKLIPTFPFPGYEVFVGFLLILLGMLVRQLTKKGS